MERDIIISRVKDMLYRVEMDAVPSFLGFLRPEEASVALVASNRKGFLYGGFDNAERVILCIYPEWMDVQDIEFPITAVTFKYRGSDNLAHKDFLGALMAIGIKRETVGDILIGEGMAVVFLLNDIVRYVLTQIETIGRVGVTLIEGAPDLLPTAQQRVSATYTVASLRLDCVVAALCNLSRTGAEEVLKDSRVMVNSVIVEKGTKTLNTGDRLTVRGYGRFDILSTDGVTRKGRTVITIAKYV